MECHLELGGDDMNHWSAIGVHSRSLRADAAGRWVLGVAGAAKISSGPNSDKGGLPPPATARIRLGSVSLHTVKIFTIELRFDLTIAYFLSPTRIRRRHPESWMSDL